MPKRSFFFEDDAPNLRRDMLVDFSYVDDIIKKMDFQIDSGRVISVAELFQVLRAQGYVQHGRIKYEELDTEGIVSYGCSVIFRKQFLPILHTIQGATSQILVKFIEEISKDYPRNVLARVAIVDHKTNFFDYPKELPPELYETISEYL